MQDIITILQNIASGMDGIAVRGMEDREMLTSCVKGLRVAIGALEGIQTAQDALPEFEKGGAFPQTEASTDAAQEVQNDHND